jgi:hypothetical protein
LCILCYLADKAKQLRLFGFSDLNAIRTIEPGYGKKEFDQENENHDAQTNDANSCKYSNETCNMNNNSDSRIYTANDETNGQQEQ